MAEALRAAGAVETRRVGDVKFGELITLDALVVGAPTHACQPSPNAKAFLKSIPANGLEGVRVAAFDTRLPIQETGPAILKVAAAVLGYAAQPMAQTLKKKGGKLVAEPEGFVVEDAEGPLREGELERAAAWAHQIIPQ